MKKRVAVVLLLVAMSLMCVFGLTACGAQSGTYDIYSITQVGDTNIELKTGEITFGEDGKITSGLYAGSSYSVSGNTLTIDRLVGSDVTFNKAEGLFV